MQSFNHRCCRSGGAGGKLILFHGWGDAAIPAPNIINYYNGVVATMGRCWIGIAPGALT